MGRPMFEQEQQDLLRNIRDLVTGKIVSANNARLNLATGEIILTEHGARLIAMLANDE